MFGPIAISAGSAAVSSAAAARARAMRALAASEVEKAPPSLAVPASSWSRMASATEAGTWDPAGPSRNAAELVASAGYSARTAWTSSTRRAYGELRL